MAGNQDPREMTRHVPWPLPDDQFPAALGAVVMRTVATGERPALHVVHSPDGDWAVADGMADPSQPGACLVQHMLHVVAKDPTVAPLASMPPGTRADRESVDSPWTYNPFTWEE